MSTSAPAVSPAWTTARNMRTSHDTEVYTPLPARPERRRDAGDKRIRADRLAQDRRAAPVDEAVGHMAGIAGDVDDLGAILFSERGIADIDAVRVEARHLDVGD